MTYLPKDEYMWERGAPEELTRILDSIEHCGGSTEDYLDFLVELGQLRSHVYRQVELPFSGRIVHV